MGWKNITYNITHNTNKSYTWRCDVCESESVCVCVRASDHVWEFANASELACSRANKLIEWMNDWLIIDWSIDWFIDWSIDLSID